MKQYNGEKAIISLTSWKARINTVGKTLYSLLKMCPDFHIVLVLSEEEFPKKEKELPEELMLFVDNDLIEILWVYKNYKSFKKVLFTMDKYRNVPIISADDDCIYLRNYAQDFYDEWLKNKDYFISCWVDIKDGIPHTGGAATLYPPFVFGENAIDILEKNKIYELTNQDDDYIYCLKKKFGLKKAIKTGNYKEIYLFHDEEKPLKKERKNDSFEKRIEKIKNYIF